VIKYFISLAIFVLLVTFGISWYLQPNDLGKCSEKPSDISGCEPVDAIVAISGGDTSARATEAIKLYKSGWSSKLIFSGAAVDKTGPSNAAVMKTLATNSGVPASDIYIDEYSETTKQNAENTKSIFEAHGIKSVILVTSGYHQRRASLEFSKRASGIKIVNGPVLADKDWSFWWWVTPYGWWLAISELFKIVVFYVTGIWS
jgi:uncharacterized SAM-binding protein YcdF (DUF218 family)